MAATRHSSFDFSHLKHALLDEKLAESRVHQLPTTPTKTPQKRLEPTSSSMPNSPRRCRDLPRIHLQLSPRNNRDNREGRYSLSLNSLSISDSHTQSPSKSKRQRMAAQRTMHLASNEGLEEEIQIQLNVGERRNVSDSDETEQSVSSLVRSNSQNFEFESDELSSRFQLLSVASKLPTSSE